MRNAARAVVHEGKIELVDQIELPEGARLLVTLVADDEEEDRAFWLAASQSSLDAIWDNPDDDVYEQLLKA
jgi:hypothetical protein